MDSILNGIKVIGFDADDTLWINEPYFQEVEEKFCQLFSNKHSAKEVSAELFSVEMQNLPSYGFGVKAFTLSLVETALRLDKECATAKIKQILELGRSILGKPVVLLDGVHKVLEQLKGRYRLIVATKGDLLDQQRKLKKSGLTHYFHHVEIMSDKRESDYKTLVDHLAIQPENFLMVGNSFKSDILPVLSLGGKGIYVPYHVTWQHEVVEDSVADYSACIKLESLSDLLTILEKN